MYIVQWTMFWKYFHLISLLLSLTYSIHTYVFQLWTRNKFRFCSDESRFCYVFFCVQVIYELHNIFSFVNDVNVCVYVACSWANSVLMYIYVIEGTNWRKYTYTFFFLFSILNNDERWQLAIRCKIIIIKKNRRNEEQNNGKKIKTKAYRRASKNAQKNKRTNRSKMRIPKKRREEGKKNQTTVDGIDLRISHVYWIKKGRNAKLRLDLNIYSQSHRRRTQTHEHLEFVTKGMNRIKIKISLAIWKFTKTDRSFVLNVILSERKMKL